MRTLSLSPMTVLPCSPLEQIDAAVDAGFDGVGLRLFPINATDVDIMSDLASQRAVEQRIAETGLKVLDIEVVRATPETDVGSIVPALEFARRLGARWLAVTAESIDTYDPADEPSVVRCLADICRVAQDNDMRVALEFMAFRGIQTLEDALRIVAAVGHPAMGVTIDALHFFRSGGTIEAVADVDPGLISCVQLSDAPREAPSDLVTEARHNRLYPGEGGLPLIDLMSVLPRELPVTVEVISRDSGHLSVFERAMKGAESLQSVLIALP
jgi:sugar phosphate isomerase/epimerase